MADMLVRCLQKAYRLVKVDERKRPIDRGGYYVSDKLEPGGVIFKPNGFRMNWESRWSRANGINVFYF